jgi:hypothetical protein
MGKAITIEFLGFAVAALCVWLAVRLVKKKSRKVKWSVAIGTAMPFAYFLGFGPMWWMVNQRWCPDWIISANIVIYWPVALLEAIGLEKVTWYEGLWKSL